MGASATEIARKLAEKHKLEPFRPVLAQVIRVADAMHLERAIDSTPQNDDRFLMWGRPA